MSRSFSPAEQHSPCEPPCTGHNLISPVTGSFRAEPVSGVHNHSGQLFKRTPNDTSADLFDSVIVKPDPVSKPPCPGVGPILGATRGVHQGASTVLQRLIQNVVRDPQNADHWGRLFSFAPACFARPSRSVEAQIRLLSSSVRSRPDRALRGLHTPRGSETSGRKHAGTRKGVSEAELVARRASAKLEEGDVKGAIRLLSSGHLGPGSTSHSDQPTRLCPSAPSLDRRATPVPITMTAPLQATPQAVLAAHQDSPSITADCKERRGSGQSQSATPGVGWRVRWLVISSVPTLQLCWHRGSLILGSRVELKLPSTRVDGMSRTCRRVTCLERSRLRRTLSIPLRRDVILEAVARNGGRGLQSAGVGRSEAQPYT